MWNVDIFYFLPYNTPAPGKYLNMPTDFDLWENYMYLDPPLTFEINHLLHTIESLHFKHMTNPRVLAMLG